jgi:hypothetical protein
MIGLLLQPTASAVGYISCEDNFRGLKPTVANFRTGHSEKYTLLTEGCHERTCPVVTGWVEVSMGLHRSLDFSHNLLRKEGRPDSSGRGGLGKLGFASKSGLFL